MGKKRARLEVEVVRPERHTVAPLVAHFPAGRPQSSTDFAVLEPHGPSSSRGGAGGLMVHGRQVRMAAM
jgi:hypothetical protein